MVFCSYCGVKNRDDSLKCYNCGEPLRSSYDDPQFINDRGNEFNNDYSENRFRGPIKDSYTSEDVNSLNDLDNRGPSFTTNDSYLNEGTTLYRREYKTSPDSNKFRKSYLYKSSPESTDSKNIVEWDVVIATALIVIILTAILNRILPNFAFFISLFIALIYILIATKNKNSLYKSVPLAIIVIFAISSYFSL